MSSLVWSALPHYVRTLTRPVAAKDYWDRGWIRRHIAKSYNALLIDRKQGKSAPKPCRYDAARDGDAALSDNLS